MKYTSTAAEKSTVKITLTFDGAEWNDAQQKAYMKLRGRFAVNGFRKGKAPRNVIENVYGKGVFFEEALNDLFAEGYNKALDELAETYVVVGEPEVAVEKVEENRSIFGKGIYLRRFTGKKVKLPNPSKKEEAALFAHIMNEFVSYLQERPDSRSIEYLAKEKKNITKFAYRKLFLFVF